jgi:hypothetical protein
MVTTIDSFQHVMDYWWSEVKGVHGTQPLFKTYITNKKDMLLCTNIVQKNGHDFYQDAWNIHNESVIKRSNKHLFKRGIMKKMKQN